MPRKKCPGGHFILGFVSGGGGGGGGGDTIYNDTGHCTDVHMNIGNGRESECVCLGYEGEF